MTDKCKLPTCGNELVHTEGRRPKEFCSPKCRTLFHNLKKVKGVGRGRPKGSKNKDKLEITVIDPQPIPIVTITDNSMTVTKDMTLDEIREKFGNEAAEKARLVMQQEIGMYISPNQPDKYGNPKQDSSGVNEDKLRDNKPKKHSNKKVAELRGKRNKEQKKKIEEDMTSDKPTPFIEIIKPPNDPKEGSLAFVMKYGVSTYEELKNKEK